MYSNVLKIRLPLLGKHPFFCYEFRDHILEISKFEIKGLFQLIINYYKKIMIFQFYTVVSGLLVDQGILQFLMSRTNHRMLKYSTSICPSRLLITVANYPSCIINNDQIVYGGSITAGVNCSRDF